MSHHYGHNPFQGNRGGPPRNPFNPGFNDADFDDTPDQSPDDIIANFLSEHTDFLSHADTSDPPNTECPICYEGIEEHICVKITNFPGCQHLIGLECLQEMLKHEPERKKECPLCRTEWIKEDGIWQDSPEFAALAGGMVPTGRVPGGRGGSSRGGGAYGGGGFHGGRGFQGGGGGFPGGGGFHGGGPRGGGFHGGGGPRTGPSHHAPPHRAGSRLAAIEAQLGHTMANLSTTGHHGSELDRQLAELMPQIQRIRQLDDSLRGGRTPQAPRQPSASTWQQQPSRQPAGSRQPWQQQPSRQPSRPSGNSNFDFDREMAALMPGLGRLRAEDDGNRRPGHQEPLGTAWDAPSRHQPAAAPWAGPTMTGRHQPSAAAPAPAASPWTGPSMPPRQQGPTPQPRGEPHDVARPINDPRRPAQVSRDNTRMWDAYEGRLGGGGGGRGF